MKIILSRKGFDDQNGGLPSPIRPDGSMVSLPIPSHDDICYSDLKFSNLASYLDIMNQLKGKIKYDNEWHELNKGTRCHLDPDLYRSIYPRENGWKRIFGQIDAAQTHLENEGVVDPDEHDLFLFFGTFRKTEYHEGILRFIRYEKPKHVIFGYLQIGTILKVNEKFKCPKWMDYHPHTCKRRRQAKNNTIYVANETLSWNSRQKGAGVFRFNEKLVLTKEGYSKSRWELDDVFNNVRISCHSKENWKREGYFQTNGIGQEFVVHADKKVEAWAKKLIDNSTIF